MLDRLLQFTVQERNQTIEMSSLPFSTMDNLCRVVNQSTREIKLLIPSVKHNGECVS